MHGKFYQIMNSKNLSRNLSFNNDITDYLSNDILRYSLRCLIKTANSMMKFLNENIIQKLKYDPESIRVMQMVCWNPANDIFIKPTAKGDSDKPETPWAEEVWPLGVKFVTLSFEADQRESP